MPEEGVDRQGADELWQLGEQRAETCCDVAAGVVGEVIERRPPAGVLQQQRRQLREQHVGGDGWGDDDADREAVVERLGAVPGAAGQQQHRAGPHLDGHGAVGQPGRKAAGALCIEPLVDRQAGAELHADRERQLRDRGDDEALRADQLHRDHVLAVEVQRQAVAARRGERREARAAARHAEFMLDLLDESGSAGPRGREVAQVHGQAHLEQMRRMAAAVERLHAARAAAEGERASVAVEKPDEARLPQPPQGRRQALDRSVDGVMTMRPASAGERIRSVVVEQAGEDPKVGRGRFGVGVRHRGR